MGCKMEAYQIIGYKPTFPVDEAGKFLYQYNKKKSEAINGKCSGVGYGLDDILKSDEKTVLEEVESVNVE